MSDIFREVDEDLRRDQLAKVWKRYGSAIVAGAVVVVAVTAGYVGWERYTASRQEARTAMLTAALDKARPAEGQAFDAKAAADALAAAGTQLDGGPAVLAKFYQAAALVRAGDTAGAIALYDQLAGSGDVGPALRDLAVVQSVLHQVDSGDPAQLQGRIAPLMGPESPWRWSAREIAGLLAIRAGDTAKAHELFKQLAEDADSPAGIRSRATELAALYAPQT